MKEEVSAEEADKEKVWRDDGRVRVGPLRAKISHVKRVEVHFGREEALVELASREHGVAVREEGCEVWVELRRLPEQFRIIARCMRDERCKRGRGGFDSKAKVGGGPPGKRRSETRNGGL